MNTTYAFVIKTINEKNTIVTVNSIDIEVPVVSGDFDFDDTGMSVEERTASRSAARQAFLKAIKSYLVPYFQGKDVEQAQTVQIPTWLKAIETNSYNLVVNNLDAQ